MVDERKGSRTRETERMRETDSELKHCLDACTVDVFVCVMRIHSNRSYMNKTRTAKRLYEFENHKGRKKTGYRIIPNGVEFKILSHLSFYDSIRINFMLEIAVTKIVSTIIMLYMCACARFTNKIG